MESLWKLNVFLLFTGLTCEISAMLLLLSVDRTKLFAARVQASTVLLLIAILLQIVGLLVPDWAISSYWFVLGALPLWVPASVLYWAQAPSTMVGTVASPASKPVAHQLLTEFQEQLRRISEVLEDHPEGLTLVEIAREMEVEWRRLTGAANELLKLGRIRKEGRRYFIQTDKGGG